MDHLPPAHEVHGTPNAHNGNATATPAPRPAAEFNRNAFLTRQIEHHDVNNDTLHRAGEAPPRSEFAQFDERLKGDFVNFLKNYTGKLSSLANEPPPPAGTIPWTPDKRSYASYTSMLDAVLDDPTHRYDKELMARIMDEEVNERGVVQSRKLNEAKLQQFLHHPEGWIITNQLIEDQAARAFLSMGLEASILPTAERNMIIQNNVVQLGIDQGVLNKLGDRMQRFLGRRALDTGGRTGATNVVGAVAGALPGWFPGRAQILNQVRNMAQGLTRGDMGIGAGAVAAGAAGAGLALGGLEAGAVVGAAALGGEALGIAWQRLMRDGVRIDLRQCGAALGSIQNNPLEAAYTKALTDVDVFDYQANGNEIVPNPGRPVAETSRDARHELLPEAMKLLYTRMEFYKQCGVPETQIDALPEQFIFLDPAMTRGEQERTGTVWQKLLMEQFNPNAPAVLGAAPEQRLQLFREARQRVMVHYLEEIARHDTTNHNRAEALTESEQGLRARALSVIEARTGEYGPEGTRRSNRQQELGRQRTEVVTEQTRLTDHQARIDAWQQARNVPNEAQQNFRREFRSLIAPGRDTTAGMITYLEPQLDAIETALRDHRNVATARGTKDTRFAARTAPAVLAQPANPGAGANPAQLREYQGALDRYNARVNEIRREVDTEYVEEQRQLEENRDRLQNQINRLETLQQEENTHAATIRNTESAVLADARDDLPAMAADFDTLTNPVGPMGVGIPEDILRRGSVAEVLAEVNRVNTANGLGWPEAENNNPVNRDRVLRAMVEARAQQEEAADAARTPARQTAFTDVTGWTITEDQLRSMNDTQLQTLINNRYTATGGAEGWDAANNAANQDRLRNAVNEARSRMLYRTRLNTILRAEDLPRRIEFIDGQVTGLDRQFGADNAEVQRYTLTTTLMNRQGEIFARAFDASFFQDRFFNDAQVVDTRRDLSPSERADTYTLAGVAGQRLPEGYIELMDTFFDYRSKPNRNALFTQITQVLPPDRLAEILDQRLNVPFNLGAPRNNLVDVMGEIRGRLRRDGVPPPPPNSLSSFDIQQAFRDIINATRDEALAMA